MDENKDGGSAFPRTSMDRAHCGHCGEADPGMSLRDYFAGQALAGLMSREAGLASDVGARTCFRIADAMIAARQKEE